MLRHGRGTQITRINNVKQNKQDKRRGKRELSQIIRELKDPRVKKRAYKRCGG